MNNALSSLMTLRLGYLREEASTVFSEHASVYSIYQSSKNVLHCKEHFSICISVGGLFYPIG